MSLRSVNISAIAILLSVLIGYEFGLIASYNAFFVASALSVVYVGYQLSYRDGWPLFAAVRAIFTSPSAYPRKAAYYAFIGCLGVGFVLTTQTVATSL